MEFFDSDEAQFHLKKKLLPQQQTEKIFTINLMSSKKFSLQLPNETIRKKQQVNIALVYQHYANRSKAYDKAFKEVIRKINDGTSISSLRRLATEYTFAAVDCILPTGVFLVSDVLNCICQTIVKHKVALIIFVTASETYDTTTAAEQYFLTLASYTGIPVIAWNADNSGFTFGKDLTPFRIIQMAPPIEHQIRAMIALLQRYGWSKFGVICSQMAGAPEFINSVLHEIADARNKSAKSQTLIFNAAANTIPMSLKKTNSRRAKGLFNLLREGKIFEMLFQSQLDITNVTDIDIQLNGVEEEPIKNCYSCMPQPPRRGQFLRAIPFTIRNAIPKPVRYYQCDRYRYSANGVEEEPIKNCSPRADPLGLTSARYLWIGTQPVRGTQTSVTHQAQAGMLSVNFHTVSNAMFAPRDDVLPLIIQLAPKLFGAALLHLSANQTISLQSTASCRSEDGPPSWDDGDKIYELMKSAFVKGNPFHVDDGYDSFFYTFNKFGKLKNSMLQISNLRKNSKGGLYWDKVGIFTNNELRMADVEWPGGRANPPQETADKFHIKVVTLHELPFIIVSDVDEDTGRCQGNQGTICDWGDEEIDGVGKEKNVPAESLRNPFIYHPPGLVLRIFRVFQTKYTLDFLARLASLGKRMEWFDC
ncbi:hypothetical protein DICVIV_02280 [Dictyocaulus viviparus]|uniref:Receptor ligand binding region domain-containing protein n=1 Tax=Dictyocaulus viviparus TaxID=29172 RepID=A0A0D8Y3T5_DICVI|nr:hypothetical protein DICVIV_02280 [Dictyocaulus viviparus]